MLTKWTGSRYADLEHPIGADHDDEAHGDPEELIQANNDSMYLEGAIWECCEAPGFVAGCGRSRHKPRVGLAKRRRLT